MGLYKITDNLRTTGFFEHVRILCQMTRIYIKLIIAIYPLIMIHPTWLSLKKNSSRKLPCGKRPRRVLLSRRSECRPLKEKNPEQRLSRVRSWRKNTHTAPKTNMEPSWTLEIDGLFMLLFVVQGDSLMDSIPWDEFITIWNTTIPFGRICLVHFSVCIKLPANLIDSEGMISVAKGVWVNPGQRSPRKNTS